MTPGQRAWAFAQVREEVGIVCPSALKWVGYPQPTENWAGYRSRVIGDATLLCASEQWHDGDCEGALETMRVGLRLLRSCGCEPPS